MRRAVRSALVACGVVVLAGWGAVGAVAAPAVWDVPGGFATAELEGELSIGALGGEPVTCGFSTASGYGVAFGSDLVASSEQGCGGGGSLALGLFGSASSDGGDYKVTFSGAASNGYSPWGRIWIESAVEADFVNAAGGQPSRLVFDEDVLGTVDGVGQVLVSGSIEVTQAGGGDLTLQ